MAQRLRITFSRNDVARYLSHLEMMRMWERTFRRAGWRLSYSKGFNPHPRISFAAPLPVAVAGESEMLDVYLDEPIDTNLARRDLNERLPPGIEVRLVEAVPEGTDALQKRVQAGEYRIECLQDIPVDRLRQEVDRILAADSLQRVRARDGKVQAYDLRPMISRLAVQGGTDGHPVLSMLLRIDSRGAGRPDEVLRELGVDPAECRITRVRLLFDC